jgi:hypothetical protein
VLVKNGRRKRLKSRKKISRKNVVLGMESSQKKLMEVNNHGTYSNAIL